MENEAPNYASWMPESGGYVANGKVVSKSPVYDENGKLKLDVDTSVFANTQPQNSPSPNTQVANQPTSVVPTANKAGVALDANAIATKIGSMGSIENNTGNATESALSSPATKSPNVEEPILTPTDQAMKEIQDAAARDDLQGEINGYIKLGELTGTDYSQVIQGLTTQRQNKIQTVDDQYLAQINDAQTKLRAAQSKLAIAQSPEEIAQAQDEYNQALNNYETLIGQQNNWRNNVGYQDAMRDKYRAEIEEIKLDFQSTWMDSINTIAGQIAQALPGILNFQYDPYQDTALQIAQGYATSRVKEQMNSTGMFYSTMTQNAIAKAVGELVPVYQKMARQEAIENFQLLQNTASFLMNLEQFQFNMWKSQIELQWEANAEKRAQVNQAHANANARGYYTNEEAAIVGVAPGTESQAARERALDKQEQLEKEYRQLQQSKALAEFQSDLRIEELEREQEINTRWALKQYEEKAAIDWNYTQKEYALANRYSGSGGSGSGSTRNSDGSYDYNFKGTLDATKLYESYNDLMDNVPGMTSEKALAQVMPDAKSKTEFNRFLAKIGEDPSEFWSWYSNGDSGSEETTEDGEFVSSPDLDKIREKDGTYTWANVKDFLTNKMSALPQGQQTYAMNDLYNNGILKQIDSDLAGIDDVDDKAASAKVKQALTHINNFEKWLSFTSLSDEAKNGYINDLKTHLNDVIDKTDNKSDNWAKNQKKDLGMEGVEIQLSADAMKEKLPTYYGGKGAKNDTGMKANAGPVVLGDKEYIDKNAYKNIMGNPITSVVSYIKKDENKPDSPENFIPVSKEKNTGLYYYYSETGAKDGQLRKKYVDEDKVETKRGGTYQFVVLTPKGNYDYSTKFNELADDRLAYMRFVEKDPDTGKYYYIKY